ncbi:hypothetical protein MKZ38_002212 [Zalerion maritima]|uniref:Uncharacterized protein n=1 Tax=Zalerion maritima TaxID=339359 RepID=A0AAD5RF61_9PEZI|nr:hypothetical protein MKZ38_002212 [Zalerion maritima]
MYGLWLHHDKNDPEFQPVVAAINPQCQAPRKSAKKMAPMCSLHPTKQAKTRGRSGFDKEHADEAFPVPWSAWMPGKNCCVSVERHVFQIKSDFTGAVGLHRGLELLAKNFRGFDYKIPPCLFSSMAWLANAYFNHHFEC